MDFLPTLLIALVSGLAGYGISLWRSRLSPWFWLEEFGESRRPGDDVQVPKELYEASEESWLAVKLPEGSITLGDVFDAFEVAQGFVTIASGDETILNQGRELLRNAATDSQTTEALRLLLRRPSISHTVQTALLRQLIFPEPYDPNREVKLRYDEDEENDGCFRIELPISTLQFGGGLRKQAYIRDRLTPFLDIVARLEREKLLVVFDAVTLMWKSQLEVNKKVRDLAEPIVSANTRWTCTAAVANFGSKPFLIFGQGAVLHIHGKRIQDFNLDCMVLTRVGLEVNSRYQRVTGVVAVQPGSTLEIALTTVLAQSEIDGNELLRAVYDQRSAQSRASVSALSNELPWRRRVISTQLDFGR